MDKTEHVDLSPDVSNGWSHPVKEHRPEAPEVKVSMVAATPKPRVVKLVMTVQRRPLFGAGSRHKATHTW